MVYRNEVSLSCSNLHFYHHTFILAFLLLLHVPFLLRDDIRAAVLPFPALDCVCRSLSFKKISLLDPAPVISIYTPHLLQNTIISPGL